MKHHPLHGLAPRPSLFSSRNPRPRCVIEPLEQRITPATFTWINAGGGSWTTPGNWSVSGADADGIPDADDNVTFNPAVAGALLTISGGNQFALSVSIPGDDFLEITAGAFFSLGASSSINGLRLSGSSISVNGLLTLTGGGSSVDGSTLAGNFRNEGTLALTGGTIRLEGATLDNAGTITQTGGQLFFQGTSPAFHNLAGALYEVKTAAGNGGFVSSGGLFDNAGTLRRDGSGIASAQSTNFHNAATGVIEVLNGTLLLNSFGSMDGGVFNVSSGATLSLENVNQTWSGNFSGAGAGTVLFRGGTISANNATLNFPAGLFQIDGSTFAGGTVTNTAALSLISGTIRLDGATLNNAGTITQTAGQLFFQGTNPTFHNFPGALYEVKTAAGNGGFVSSGGLFDNAGTLRRDGSGVASAQNANFHNAATGVIEVLNGTLLLNSFGSMDGGVFNVGSGATLSFENVNQTWSGNFSGSGAGTVLFRSGRLSVNDVTLNFPGGMFLWDNEGIFATGTVTNIGALTLGDRLVRLDSATLNNAGTITQTVAQLVFNGTNPALHNLAGGVFEVKIAGNGTFAESSGLFDNAGTLRRDGAGTQSMSGGVSFSNTGTVEIVSGGLAFGGPVAQISGSTLTAGTWIVDAGASLSLAANIVTNNAVVEIAGTAPQLDKIVTNNGTLNLRGGHDIATTGNFTNSGALSLGPGSTLTANGTFTSGANSRIEFQIGGVPASGNIGRLVSTGAAALAGTAAFAPAGGFGPTQGQSFTLATFPSHTGSFGKFEGVYLQQTKIFDPQLSATSLVLNAVADAADLDPSVTSTPASGVSGQNVTVSFKVTNTAGTATFTSAWTDSVFLSFDGVLDPSDKLVGRVPHTGALAAGAFYNASLTAPLPGVVPGAYRFIVVADSGGEMPDSDRANNLEASGAIVTDVTALTPGVLVTGTIANGQDVYFRVDLAPGETPLFKTTYGANGAAEIFVAQAAVPTRSSFDAQSFSASSASAAVSGLAPLAGTFYILLHGREGAGAGQPFSLAASTLSFAISSVEHDRGANVGSVTATLHGSQFGTGTTFALVSGGTAIAASKVYFQDAATAYATFDLTGAALGNYDVRAANGAATATLPAAFHVIAGTAGSFTFNISSPRYIRPTFGGVVATLSYTNTGGTDLIAPVVTISGDNAKMRLAGEEGFSTGTIEVLAISSDGPAGILAPGASGTLMIEFEPETVAAHGLSTLTAREAGLEGSAIDWNLLKDDLRPRGMAVDAWDALYPNFVAQMGTTYAQYNALLADNATYLSLLGHRTADVGELTGYELLQAGDFGSIAQRYELGALGRGHTAPFDVRAFTASPQITLPAGFVPRLTPTVLRDADGNVGGIIFGFTDAEQQAFQRERERLGDELFRAAYLAPYLDDVAGVEGNVSIQIGDEVRSFISSGAGNYVGVPGETGQLVRLPSGALQLTELDGFKTLFRASDGRIDYTEDTSGNRVTAGYDTSGRLLTLSGTNGDVTTFTYNAAGRIVQSADAVGHVTTFTYDAANEHLLSTTDAAGTVSYTYVTGQGMAREHAPASITLVDGSHVFFTYDAQGRLISQERDGGAERVTFSYDSAGTITQADSLGHGTSVFRDQNAQAARLVDALGRVSFALYDDHGKLLRTASPGGITNLITYDSGGGLSGFVNPAGGRVDLEIGGDFSRLLALTDTRGNATHYSYDTLGRLASITDALGSAETYGYDAEGRVTQYVNHRGQVAAYTYDSHGLLLAKDLPGTADDVTYTYDAHRNLLSATDAGGATSYEYDSADRVTKVTFPGGKFVSYTYDTAGRRTSIADQSGFTVHYIYDALGRLDEVTDTANATLDDYDYDTLGRIEKETHGNGSTTDYAYDSLDRVIVITHRAPDNSVLESFTYTYDLAGRITTQVSSVSGTTTYGYDVKGQLTNVQLPGGRTIAYAYDSEGNRTVVSDSAAGTTDYAANAANEYLTAGATTFTHDADGNLVARSGGTSYTYDAENRLIAAVTPDGTFTYDYDAAGNRIGMTKNGVRTDFLIDPLGGGNVFAEYGSGGALTAHYAQGLGLASRIDSGGASAFYHYDLTGNTQLLTGAGGAVQNTYEYLPFGEKIGSTGTVANAFTYNGAAGVQENGAGLYDMRARAYDPALGRFMQVDPIGINSGETNTYRYALNSPVKYSDPSGLLFIGGLPGGTSPGLIGSLAFRAGIFLLFDAPPLVAAASATANAAANAFIGPIIETVFYVGVGAYDTAAGAAAATQSFLTGGGTAEAALSRGGRPAAALLENSFRAVSNAGNGARFLTAGELLAPALIAAGGGVLIGTAIDQVTEYTNPGLKDSFREQLANQFNLKTDPNQPLVDKSGLNNAKFNNLTRQTGQDPLINAVYKRLIGEGESPTEAIEHARQLVRNYRNNNPNHDTTSETITPHDPNNIIGPNGVGAEPILDDVTQATRFDGFIRPDGRFDYTIQFENDATASAPAQTIVITHTLDSDLDLSTFQLGSFGFGTIRVDVPAGLDHYSKLLQTSGALGVNVEATIALDHNTRQVRWTLTSLDPVTGDLPTDPFAGLLPPNVTLPQGDGYVTYSIAPVAGLASGARIDAQASIVFDTEAAILTPAVHNIIDSLAPTSSVAPLPATTVRGAFRVNISAADEIGGSGLGTISVFYRDNGGPLQLLAAEAPASSSLIFRDGVAGHTYTFFSIASDRVGNDEELAATPDTTIDVVAPVFVEVGKKRVFTDSDGDVYTVKFTGKSGAAKVALLDPDGDGKGAIDFLQVDGADAKGKVTVTVKNRNSGDGAVAIGDVIVNGDLGAFAATKSDLVVNGLDATGTVKKISVRDLLRPDAPLADPLIALGGTNVDKTTITARNLSSGFAINTPGIVSAIKAAAIGDGTITAAALAKLNTTAGGMDADLAIIGAVGPVTIKGGGANAGNWSGSAFGNISITGGSLDADLTTIGAIAKITVKADKAGAGGNITGATITAAKIGDLTVAQNVTSSMILAGAHLGDDFAPGGTGTAADTFAAGSIGVVKIGGAATDAIIGAGLSTTDAIFGDADDTILGGATSSIAGLTITGTATGSSYFAAGAIKGKPKINAALVTPVAITGGVKLP